MRRLTKANHVTSTPSSHIVIDCETTPSAVDGVPNLHCHRLRLGCATAWRMESGRQTRRQQLVFRDWTAIHQFILGRASTRNPLWIWCHNAGFDLTAIGFWHMLDTGDLTLSAPAGRGGANSEGDRPKRPRPGMIVTGDPPTIIRAYTREGATVWCLDTLNWHMCPLRDLGEAIGFPKLDMPGELGSDEDWRVYCQRDTDILERVVVDLLGFIRAHDLGNMRCTAAGQAMAMYRHRCMTDLITIDDDPGHKVMERESYYGGRREVYYAGAVVPDSIGGLESLCGMDDRSPFMGRGPVYHLDLTGAYPSVMRGHPYPVRYYRANGPGTPDRLALDMPAYGAVARVRINSDTLCWPVRRQGRTIQACGRFDTTLCGPELMRALRSNCVRHVYGSQLYSMGFPFDKFVDEGWAMRQSFRAAGKPLWERLAKTLLNALHGKFAQRRAKWELLPGQVAPTRWGVEAVYDTESKRIRNRRYIGGTVHEEAEAKEHPESSPIIAAYAVAYCRERMLALRSAAGTRDCLYEDADSLHVTQEGYDRLCRAGHVGTDRLGSLRVVRSGDRAVYRGPQDYALDDHVVLGGVGSKAKRDEKGMWHQTDFARLDAMLGGVPPEGPLCYERTLSRPEHLIAARVLPSGWTEPLRLDD